MGDSPSSVYEITYPDLDEVYSASVLDMGRSRRMLAKPNRPSIGTKMRAKVNRLTGLESNRFVYESFKTSEQKKVLLSIRRSLENLPEEMALAKFSKNEQLAYWLNLYNVTVIEALANYYPKKSLKNMINGDSNFFTKKILNIAGIPRIQPLSAIF